MRHHWIALMLLLSVTFCRSAVADDTQPAEIGAPATEIKLNQAAERKAGIETVRPTTESLPVTIPAFGMVLSPGRLTALAGNYATVAAQMQGAAAKLDASRAGIERAQRLFRDEHNFSAAELETATETFRADEAVVADLIAQRGTIEATLREEFGKSIASSVTGGSDLARRIILGDAVLLRLTVLGPMPRHPPRAFAFGNLSLDFLGLAGGADPHVSGAAFLFTALADPRLLPGATLSAQVEIDESSVAMTLPEAAVVRWQGLDWVYVRSAGGFIRHRIELGTAVTGKSGIKVTGLAPDSDVVGIGAQLLLSEEFKGSAQTGDDD